MKNIFYYFLLLSVFIVPLFLIFEHEEKFPILLGVFFGVTAAFWGAIIMMRKKGKKRKKN
jgi:uncharacterized membrane protein